jgi:hypothetical protein
VVHGDEGFGPGHDADGPVSLIPARGGPNHRDPSFYHGAVTPGYCGKYVFLDGNGQDLLPSRQANKRLVTTLGLR